MATYDTTQTNRNEIAADIVERTIAPGTTTKEVLTNAGSVEAAAQAVVEFYEDDEDDEDGQWPTDENGEDLDVHQYALEYFQYHAALTAAEE